MDESSESIPPVKISIWTPLLYVGVLLGSFIAFSIYYRRRKVQQLSQKIEPIFSDNHTATLYAFLKQQYTNEDLPKDQKPHEKVLKAALLRRGVEAIRRSLKLKEVEPSFNKLYQEGLVGEDIFKSFLVHAKIQEIELKDIVAEAESYKKGWSQQFFAVAQEVCFNEALRRRLKAMDERSKTLAVQWQYLVANSETLGAGQSAKSVVEKAAQGAGEEEVKDEKKEENKAAKKEEKKKDNK